MTNDELREAVAHLFRTMYAFEADRRYAADAAIALIRAETLEEAARVAEAFPARTHGNLSADPFEAAEQAASECAAAIRAMKEKSE